MIIILSPSVGAAPLQVEALATDCLRINGEDYDFSSLPEGATIEAGVVPSALVGDIERKAGQLHLSLLLPLGPYDDEPHMTHPEPIEVTGPGPLDLPFTTYTQQVEERVEGGVNIITTVHRWRHHPVATSVFVADEEAVDVDA